LASKQANPSFEALKDALRDDGVPQSDASSTLRQRCSLATAPVVVVRPELTSGLTIEQPLVWGRLRRALATCIQITTQLTRPTSAWAHGLPGGSGAAVFIPTLLLTSCCAIAGARLRACPGP
jgi:hypothetical protein